MATFTTPRNTFEIDYGSRKVRADGDSMGKISGTMLSAVLGCSPWASPFTAACELLGLGTEDISAKPAVRTGHVLESVVLRYAEGRYSSLGTFLGADEVYGKREGEHSDWSADFDDDSFTGHVDGLIMTPEGEDYILEIKTSSNGQMWEQGVPEHYFWQVALYDRFITRKGRAYLVRGALGRDVYDDPSLWEPSEDNVTMYTVELDKDVVDEGIGRAKEWLEELRRTRTTPPADMSRPADAAMFNHLCELDSCDRTFESLIDEYGNVRRQLKESEDEYKWLSDKEERLKGILKAHMEMNDMTTADSKSGRYAVSLASSKRRTVDQTLMREAGIDPEPFMKETVYKTLKLREPKVKDIWQ